MSEFKEANLSTKIDQGTIWVSKILSSQSLGYISTKLASLLSKLNIKPIEAGIVVNYALSDKLVFEEKDLRINLNEFRNELSRAHNESIALAIESITLQKNQWILIVQGIQKCQNACNRIKHFDKRDCSTIISKSAMKANNLAAQLKSKGYTSN